MSHCITVSKQKISSIHKLIHHILGSHELNDLTHLWPDPPKDHWNNLAFLNLHQDAKNQFIPSIQAWNTACFRVPWPDWSHPFLTKPIQKLFDQLLIHVNLYQHAKNSGYCTDLFWRYGWLKNPTIWLAENILAHISGTRIFPNTGFII